MKYTVKQSDPSNALFAGQEIQPMYEDGKEIIVPSSMPGVLHHIKKDGEYFKTHLQEVK